MRVSRICVQLYVYICSLLIVENNPKESFCNEKTLLLFQCTLRYIYILKAKGVGKDISWFESPIDKYWYEGLSLYFARVHRKDRLFALFLAHTFILWLTLCLGFAFGKETYPRYIFICFSSLLPMADDIPNSISANFLSIFLPQTSFFERIQLDVYYLILAFNDRKIKTIIWLKKNSKKQSLKHSLIRFAFHSIAY